jgi:hypothetical protein
VLLENELHGVRHLRRERSVCALQRQIRSNQEVGIAIPAVPNRATRRGRKRLGFAPSAVVAPATAAGSHERERNRDYQYC